MPIVFEQPDAVSQFASAYAGHGAAEQYNLDREFQLRQQQLQGQAAQANANRITAAQAQQNQLGLQAGQQQLQSYALGQQGQVTPAMEYQAQQQRQLVQQHAQAQMAMQAQSFTMADQMQLNRLKQADSYIDQQASAGQWSQDEVAQAKAQVRGVMGPLQMKEQQARTAKEKQQTEQLQHLNAQAKAVDIQNQQADAEAAQAGATAVMHRDGQGNTHKLYMKKDGTIYDPLAHTKGKSSPGDETGGFDFAKHFDTAIKGHTDKETGKVDFDSALADTKRLADAHNELRQQQVLAKNPVLVPVNNQLMGGIAAARAAGDTQAAQEIEAVRRSMFEYPNLKEMPPDSLAYAQAVQAKYAQYINQRAASPASESQGQGGGPPPTPGQLPPGTRESPKMPGYAIPSHWVEGVHYRVGKDESGRPAPEVINRDALNEGLLPLGLNRGRLGAAGEAVQSGAQSAYRFITHPLGQ